MEFTSNKNLYKWKTTDTKRNTIAEMANNAQKIDEAFGTIDGKVNGLPERVGALETGKADQEEVDTLSSSVAQKATKKKMDNVWIDVKEDFGAKGDGITDDTLSIQNAINSLKGKGGTVYFPDGLYLTTGNEITFSFVRILGQSKHAVLKLKDGSNNTILSIKGIQTSYCVVESLMFHGNKTNNASGNGIYIEHNSTQPNDNPTSGMPLNMYDARHRLEDLLIENCADNGLFIDDFVNGVSGSGVRELYVNDVYIGYCGKTGLLSYAQDSMFNEVTAHHSPRGIFIGGGNCKWSNIKMFWCNSDNENFVIDGAKPWETASLFINAVRTIISNLEIQDWYGKYALSMKDCSDVMGENIHVETCKSTVENTSNAVYIDGGTRNRLKMYTNFNSNVSAKMGKITINNTSRLYFDLMTRFDYASIMASSLLSITLLTNAYVRINERVRHDSLVDGAEFFTDTNINVTTESKGIKFRRNNKDRLYFFQDGTTGQVRMNHYDNTGTYKGSVFSIAEDGGVNIGTTPANGGKAAVFGNTPIVQQTLGVDATDLASAISLINELKLKLKNYGWFG